MNISEVDWSDQTSVIKYAEQLGGGVVVFKDPSATLYNLAQEGSQAYDPAWVIHETDTAPLPVDDTEGDDDGALP